MLGWHAPSLYQAALSNGLLHRLEHATMFGSGWLLWRLLLRGGGVARARYGQAVVALAGVGAAGGGLGAILVFSPRPWYPAYAATGTLTPLEDQQLAGLIMWTVGGGLAIASAVGLFVAWLAAVERRAVRRESGAVLRGGTGLLAWAALGAVVLAGCTAPLQSPTPAAVGDVERGRQALMDYGCVACHAVPGLPVAQGNAGHPLGGLANRQVIAGRLPNDPENLARWIRDPQGISPGNAMPDLGVTEADARDMAAFLSSPD